MASSADGRRRTRCPADGRSQDNATPSASNQEDEPVPSVRDRLERKPLTSEPDAARSAAPCCEQGRFSEAQQRAFDPAVAAPAASTAPRATRQPRDFDAAFGAAHCACSGSGFGNGRGPALCRRSTTGRDLHRHRGARTRRRRPANALGRGRQPTTSASTTTMRSKYCATVADGTLDEIRISSPIPGTRSATTSAACCSRVPRPAVRTCATAAACTSPPIGRTMPKQMWDVLDATPGLRNAPVRAAHVPRPHGGRRRISKPAASAWATVSGLL